MRSKRPSISTSPKQSFLTHWFPGDVQGDEVSYRELLNWGCGDRSYPKVFRVRLFGLRGEIVGASGRPNFNRQIISSLNLYKDERAGGLLHAYEPRALEVLS